MTKYQITPNDSLLPPQSTIMKNIIIVASLLIPEIGHSLSELTEPDLSKEVVRSDKIATQSTQNLQTTVIPIAIDKDELSKAKQSDDINFIKFEIAPGIIFKAPRWQ